MVSRTQCSALEPDQRRALDGATNRRALCHDARVRKLATTWAEGIRILSLTIERLLRR